MATFEPEIGLVIRHAYLWRDEARRGRQEGTKDRPCVIIHTRRNEHGETEVFIAPITHSAPRQLERAITLPPATKARLGLDEQDSWMITTEVNRFIWPGPDLRPLPDGRVAYGFLPARMARDVIRQVQSNARDRSLRVVVRDDEVLNELLRQRRGSSKQDPDRGS
jgi:hypothetical protein